ncbi:MAG: hypothetical protein ABL914_03760 [Novosphingobium sp.]|uniref:hypothetical protein n=1 Tax=Novosphingobium sp. TaxID=1874826 RepID=UPI0032BE6688
MKLARSAAAGLGLVASGCAYAPAPITVNSSASTSTFAEAQTSPASPLQSVCVVQILEVTDTRLDPDTIGIIFDKAIKAPKDRTAWLRGMIASLESRGIDVVFPDEIATSTPLVSIRIHFDKAWLMDNYDAVVSSVLFRVVEPKADGTVSQVQFTGKDRASTILKLGAGQANSALDSALTQALDSMALHLKGRCAGKLARRV